MLETVPFAAKTVLEIGCGTGHYTRALAPTATSYIALDLSEAMLKAAKEHCAGTANITFPHADAQAIPLPEMRLIWSSEPGRSAPSGRQRQRRGLWARSTVS